MTTLDQTPEWQDLWSHQLLEIIQTYDRELSDRRKEEAARSKARQKRARHEQDQAMFDEVSKENAEHIRQEVLRQYTAGKAQLQAGPEAMEKENVPIRRSSRLQGSNI